MRLAIVTDEIAPDPVRAIRLGLQWGIRDFELRKAWDRRVPDLERPVLQRLLAFRADEGVRYTALSPGLFKQPLRHPDTRRDLTQRLPRTLEMATLLGVEKIITFGFPRAPDDPPDAPEAITSHLREAAELTASAGLLLCLEPERGFWCSTGAESARTVRAAGHPALRINWDPGNCAAAGERPYPDGYEAVRGLVAHVHVKDYRPGAGGGPGRWVAPGDGVVDWQGQIAALVADGAVPYLTIETHFGPTVEASRLCVERVRAYLRACGVAA